MTFVLLPLAHDWSACPIYLLHLTGPWPWAHWRLCIDCLGFWMKPASYFPFPSSPLLPVVYPLTRPGQGYFCIQLTRKSTNYSLVKQWYGNIPKFPQKSKFFLSISKTPTFPMWSFHEKFNLGINDIHLWSGFRGARRRNYFGFLQLTKKIHLRSVLNHVFLCPGATYTLVGQCQHLFLSLTLIWRLSLSLQTCHHLPLPKHLPEALPALTLCCF